MDQRPEMKKREDRGGDLMERNEEEVERVKKKKKKEDEGKTKHERDLR